MNEFEAKDVLEVYDVISTSSNKPLSASGNKAKSRSPHRVRSSPCLTIRLYDRSSIQMAQFCAFAPSARSRCVPMAHGVWT